MSVARGPVSEVAEPDPDAAAASASAPRGLALGRRAGTLRTFESLHDRNFRWFFLSTMGQFAALQTQMLAMGFLVFELTGSPGRLGLVALVSAVPALGLSLHGGVLADRASRRLVLQAGQVFQALLAAIVAALLFLDLLRYEQLIVIAFFQGAAMALMMPARQAIIPEIAGEERLMNAVSLSAAAMTSMRLVAPAIGGVLIALTSTAWLYVAIVIYFAIAIVTLVPIRLAPRAVTSHDAESMRGWEEIKDALRYTARRPVILQVLALNLLIVSASMPYMFLLPGFVDDVLGLGGVHLGVLLSLMGVGSLFGALVVASLPPRRRGLLYMLSAVLLGVGVLAFAATDIFWLSALITVMIGVGHALRMSLSNVLLQGYVDNAYRGRVMSIYMMEFGLVAFGVFAVGAFAEVVGLQIAIGGTSAVLLVVALLLFPAFPQLRRLQ